VLFLKFVPRPLNASGVRRSRNCRDEGVDWHGTGHFSCKLWRLGHIIAELVQHQSRGLRKKAFGSVTD
jgi:hypothetical protein